MNGLAFGVLVGTGGGALWYLTYVYYRRVHRTSWFDEWRAVYGRALAGVGIGFAVASLAWRGEKNLFDAPGWASIAAGGLGLAAGLLVAYLFGLKQSGGQTHLAGGWIKLPDKW
jgi:drug/metabolite transporter (DMT)-like permease